ncbi:choice-of-anchor M domain-containing protein [Bifidobacterium aquikefiricola]|uniref:Choice-of-anchor M domain-containing protein n=1 Tax=Bifidobacterium aquikefiricola TaxID=3059038 RepID=A0AB39U691_9BIFI
MMNLHPFRRRIAALLATLTSLAALGIPALAYAEDGEDPNLNQTIGELAIVHGQRELVTGHIDMGPKYDQGVWRFLIHDDVAKADANATSVWRYPDETVFHVLDAAKLAVPEDPAYSFVGAAAGSDVYVVPQTQNPEVVWIGWNTQDPEVMNTIERGITLSLTGVQGPGIMTTYLQSGSFGEPQVLWDSRKSESQPIWVDVNTHTHANWVFTQPGVYLVELTAEAELRDGSHVTDTQHIRFAVGTATTADQAFAQQWQGSSAAKSDHAGSSDASGGASGNESADGSADKTKSGGSAATGQSGQEGSAPANTALVAVLIGAIIVVFIALVAGFTVVIVRGNKAKRRILDDRRRKAESEAETGGDQSVGGGI